MIILSYVVAHSSSEMPCAMTTGVAGQHEFEQLRRLVWQSRAEMQRRLRERERRLRERDRQVVELTRKVAEQNRTLSELNRRIVEYDQRFDDIVAEVARVRVAEDLRVKQKSVSPTVNAGASSSREVSVSEQSSMPLPCIVPLSASGGAFNKSSLVSAAGAGSRKRKQPPLVHPSKHGRKNGDQAPVSDIRHLRSGRCVVFK